MIVITVGRAHRRVCPVLCVARTLRCAKFSCSAKNLSRKPSQALPVSEISILERFCFSCALCVLSSRPLRLISFLSALRRRSLRFSSFKSVCLSIQPIPRSPRVPLCPLWLSCFLTPTSTETQSPAPHPGKSRASAQPADTRARSSTSQSPGTSPPTARRPNPSRHTPTLPPEAA